MNTSTGATITLDTSVKPTTSAEKEATKAAERRREQNREAQRKHRSKARGREERQLQGQRTQYRRPTSAQGEQVAPAPEDPGRHTRSGSIEDVAEAYLGAEPQGDHDPWSGTGMPMMVDETSFFADEDLTNIMNPCLCNNISGPCEFHRQSIRAEGCMSMMLDTVDTLPLGSPIPILPEGGSDTMLDFPVLLPAQTPQRRQGKGSKDILTSRFENLLQHVRAAGFKAFDEAVIAYYIHEFDPLSEPELAQKTSRGRRLRHVLTAIGESSADWTFWEARGYRDQILEAAEKIYMEEMAQLLQGDHRPGPSDSLNSFMDGITDECTASLFSQTPVPGSLEKVYQNNARHPRPGHVPRLCSMGLTYLQSPNLWALLTSLAGYQGASSGLAACSALSLLRTSARYPDIDVGKHISKLAIHLNSLGSSLAHRSTMSNAMKSASMRCGSSSGGSDDP